VTPLRVEAPAKLNLSLRVVARRDDGFHELDGVMLLLELADHLLLTPGCSGLRVTDPDGAPVGEVPVDPEANLAWRGLRAGLGRSPDEALVCLALEKRIPVRGGLGGGSSDAAAAWRLARGAAGEAPAATPDDLAGLARIGADVPFFAACAVAARVRGIGERVEPIAPPASLEVVLAHPRRGLATAAVFAELRHGDWSSEVADDVDSALAEGTNDLWRPALRLEPELEEIAALVAAAGGHPRLTGSGPTLFAITDDPERADGIAARLARAGVRTTRTRSRAQAATIQPIDQEEA
jgi:4-diphosphocytidyl-2-C-methyl-D-erythritol kinase